MIKYNNEDNNSESDSLNNSEDNNSESNNLNSMGINQVNGLINNTDSSLILI